MYKLTKYNISEFHHDRNPLYFKLYQYSRQRLTFFYVAFSTFWIFFTTL